MYTTIIVLTVFSLGFSGYLGTMIIKIKIEGNVNSFLSNHCLKTKHTFSGCSRCITPFFTTTMHNSKNIVHHLGRTNSLPSQLSPHVCKQLRSRPSESMNPCLLAGIHHPFTKIV